MTTTTDPVDITNPDALRAFCLDAMTTLLRVMDEQRKQPQADDLCAALYNHIVRIRLTEQERVAALVCATLALHQQHQPQTTNTPCHNHQETYASNQS